MRRAAIHIYPVDSDFECVSSVVAKNEVGPSGLATLYLCFGRLAITIHHNGQYNAELINFQEQIENAINCALEGKEG